MRSYRDNRWLLSSDAHTNKMAAYVENLPDDWEWLWILPERYQSDQAHGRWDLLPNVKIERIPWGDNVQEARFFFPIREWKAIVKDFEPDVCILETPEHVQAHRLVQERTGVRYPVIAYWQHVSLYDETHVPVDYMMRQREGYINANMRVFPLHSMKTEFIRYLGEDTPRVREESVVWPGIYSPVELEENNPDAKREPSYTFFFIGRLSDNQRTHWKEFAGACQDLRDAGASFKVWVANPNEAQSWDEIRKWFGPAYEPHPYGEKTLGRAEYLDLLWRADCVPFLYPMDRIYSVGFSEAVTAGNAIITPQTAMRFPALGPLSKPTATGIAMEMSQLMAFADGEPEKYAARLAQQEEWMFAKRSIEDNVEIARETIERAVEDFA